MLYIRPKWMLHYLPTRFNNQVILPILLVITLTIMMIAGTLLRARPAFAQGHLSLDPVSCEKFGMLTLPGSETAADCGYLTVPEEYEHPDGKNIQIAYVRLKNNDVAHAPVNSQPLFMAQGGPGGSTIDTYLTPMMGHPILKDRDIILFDQRGTQYSRPNLNCPEIDTLTIETLDQQLSLEESERLNLAAMIACRERLVNDGINLSAFDSLENARDIDSLRKALGYDKIHLYGVSYGTLLALQYMRLFPETLRSVILDGVVPPQTNFILEAGQNQDRAFSRFFDTCRQDTRCNQEFPDLEKVFFDLVDQLNEKPVEITVSKLENGMTYPGTLLTGDTFQWMAFQLLYSGDILPMLPRMIYDVKRGDYEVTSRLLGVLLFDQTMSYGMYYSVICAEDADFSPSDQDLGGVRPQIARIEERSPQQLLNVCAAWDVEALGPDVDDPVQIDVPTLLLSGAFDPITPAENAETAAASLPTSFTYVFPTGAHGQLLGDCADGIVQDFLNQPEQAPNASCIQEETTPAFYTSDRIIVIPAVIIILNLDPATSFQLLFLLAGMLFLWTSVLVFPLAWLINKLNQRQPATDFGNLPASGSEQIIELSPQITAPVTPTAPGWLNISSWIAVMGAIVLTVFLVAIGITVGVMLNANDNRLFYGLAGEARPWFILPLIFLLIALMMMILAVALWIHSYGSVLRRLYYSLLAFTAFGCTAILGVLRLLFGFF